MSGPQCLGAPRGNALASAREHAMGEMQVQVPDGTPPGGQMQVMTPQGAMMVQVPPDKKPGDMFTFMVPNAPPMGAAVAQPMSQGAMMQPVVAQGAVMQPAVMQPVVAQGAVMQPVAAQPATVVVQQQSFQQPVVYGRHSVRITCPDHTPDPRPGSPNPDSSPILDLALSCTLAAGAPRAEQV